MDKEQIEKWFRDLQSEICRGLEKEDQKGKFEEDTWERPGGGGGITRIIRNGNVIEKGGVNWSAVHGKTPPNILKALKLEESDFFATGVSIVIHPLNPWVPIIHMNVRYFEMSNGTYWFGGGIDLTPHYVVESDARFFHSQLKETCDQFDLEYYPKFKKWADDYFYIKHRKETRGIGGIFFDRLQGSTQADLEHYWNFTQAVGKTFLPTYIELIRRNRDKSYADKELDWQRVRRGRYVEFNLVYDKGTKFGLDTDGRTESILMSLPPLAQWEYDHQPNEKEKETLSFLRKELNWVVS